MCGCLGGKLLQPSTSRLMLPPSRRPCPAGLPLTQLRTGAGSLFTPPLAASMRTVGPGSALGPTELLWPPEGDASRLAAQPEQQPLPYTQRVHVTGAVGSAHLPLLVCLARGACHHVGDGLGCTAERPPDAPAVAAGALSYGSRTLPPTAGTADASSGDGMENLTHQTARLRFGRDLRLLEVRNLLRSSAPVVLRLGAAPEVGGRHVAWHLAHHAVWVSPCRAIPFRCCTLLHLPSSNLTASCQSLPPPCGVHSASAPAHALPPPPLGPAAYRRRGRPGAADQVDYAGGAHHGTAHWCVSPRPLTAALV